MRTIISLPLATLALVLSVMIFASASVKAAEPFRSGWTLDPKQSVMTVLSVKNGEVVEASKFHALTGEIDEDGTATLKVMLDSIDTGIDLRNVRMRFLFFQTFRFPEATVTVTLERDKLAPLAINRREKITLDYTLALHGVKKSGKAWVTVTLLDDDTVAVTTLLPIMVAASDYGLSAGIQKLEEAASVEIVPTGTIGFDLLFHRNDPSTPADLPVALAAANRPAALALEAETFGIDECKGRLEILSRTESITFRAGSATLMPASSAILDSVADIIGRCPALNVEIAGHTDADGGASYNQRLSEQRAQAVMAYLRDAGVNTANLAAVGYGESRPKFPNDTPDNKRRNRRIEFVALD